MAKPEQLALLKKGVGAWNKWIREHPDVQVDLSGADFSLAYLNGADLIGADLSEARSLTQNQMDRAHGDKDTKLPDGIQRPAHWKTESDGP